jgi:hypothetical protein
VKNAEGGGVVGKRGSRQLPFAMFTYGLATIHRIGVLISTTPGLGYDLVDGRFAAGTCTPFDITRWQALLL